MAKKATSKSWGRRGFYATVIAIIVAILLAVFSDPLSDLGNQLIPGNENSSPQQNYSRNGLAKQENLANAQYEQSSPIASPTPEPPPIVMAEYQLPYPIVTTLSGVTNSIAWIYVGEVVNEVPHGSGRIERADNSWFEGEWFEGSYLNGRGLLMLGSNSWYYGYLYLGLWSEGIFVSGDGTRYEGSFAFSSGRQYRHGNGRIEWPNGDYYCGEWRYNQRHGQGAMFHAESGMREEGYWRYNVLQ